MSKFVCPALVLAALVLHLSLSVLVPATPDELYYWCWAKEPQWSYYDHPPMTAYFIWASTSILGDNLFAVRLPACLCMCVVLTMVSRLMRAPWLLALMLATPLCFFGGILITPDSPLLCMWALYLAWLVHLHTRLADVDGNGPTWRTWMAGGVLLGLGVLSKYTMGLAGITVALSLVTIRPWSRWLAGLVLHGVVAFIVALPILIYNIQRDFEPLTYQWQHTMEVEAPSIRYLPEYIGGQILFVGLLPFTLSVWLLYRWRLVSADPRLRACLWMFLAPFLFFLYKASRDRIELNWPVACYLAFLPLAAFWFEQNRERPVLRWMAVSGFTAPIVMTIVLTWHLISPIGLLSPERDIVHRCASFNALSHDVDMAVHRHDPDVPVFARTYQDTAFLRFHHVRAEQLLGASRPSHFTQRPVHPEQQSRFLLFSYEAPTYPGFSPPQLLEKFDLNVRGQITFTYMLVRYEKVGAGPAVAKVSQGPLP